jgi:protein phosphatase
MWGFCAQSVVGHDRDQNEDRLLVDPERGLAVVADGMGGHAAGEVASSLAVEAIDWALSRERLRAGRGKPWAVQEALIEALFQAHTRVKAAARQDPRKRGMGCAVVVALITRARIHVANVGDARAYLCAATGLTQLSTDHTSIALLLASGQLTPDAARQSPLRGELYQAVGVGYGLHPTYRRHTLKPGDRVLLCSDGLTDPLADAEIESILHADLPVAAACGELLERAEATGRSDDTTVVVVDPSSRAPTACPPPSPGLAPTTHFRA